MPHIDVQGVAAHAADEAPVPVQPADLVCPALRGTQPRDGGRVTFEKVGDVDDGAGRVGAAGFDVPRREDGSEVVGLDRCRDGQRIVGDGLARVLAEQNTVPAPLEAHHLAIGGHSGGREAAQTVHLAGDAAHQEHVPAEERVRDLEEVVVVLVMDGEEAVVGLGVFDHVGVGGFVGVARRVRASRLAAATFTRIGACRSWTRGLRSAAARDSEGDGEEADEVRGGAWGHRGFSFSASSLSTAAIMASPRLRT